MNPTKPEILFPVNLLMGGLYTWMDTRRPPDPHLVARHKNRFSGVGPIVVYQANAVIVVHYLRPVRRRLVNVGVKVPLTSLVDAGDNG